MSGKKKGRSRSPARTTGTISPGSTSSTPTVSGASSASNPMDQFLDMLQKSSIKRDEESEYKSIKIPQFSDGTEWEAVVFELEVNLEKVWKYEHEMDIID